MRTIAIGLFLLTSTASLGSSQVIVQSPPNIAAPIACSQFPVLPSNLVILYELINTRSNGGTGQWRLTYSGQHANETISNAQTDRFLSAGVDVEELFSDMGVWVMRDNWGKNRWLGECARLTSGFSVVWGIGIMGNLQQVEPPPPPPPPGCPPEWVPDGDGCVGASGPYADPPGGGGGDPPPFIIYEWYEYTYYNWSYGVWTALYTWLVCE